MNKFGVSLFLAFAAAGSSLLVAAQDFAGRSVEDKLRDATSKPQEVIELVGVKSGDSVLDFLGGGGYYSELLATVVGQQGNVVLHNNQAYMPYVKEQLTKRFNGERLPNVTRLLTEVDDLQLGTEKFDSVFLVLGYHDMHFKDTGWDMNVDTAFPQLYRALKPGGKLLIIDHNSAVDRGIQDAKELHRIDKEFAKQDIQARGFKLLLESDILSNPSDKYDTSIFAKELRRKTDRFILIFEKERQ